jgi:Fe-S-cluster containining protein
MLTPRQVALAEQLASDPAYASGRRAFPRTVTPDDAADIAGALHDEMDAGAAARAVAARRMGRPLACGAGCTGCCEEMVMVFEPETLRVVRWLEQPENAAAKQAFLEAYGAWRERTGDAPDRLAAAFASGDEAAHLELHTQQWRKRILCAFNRAGLCTIYPVRPLVCRNAHALDTAAQCYGDSVSEKPAARLHSPELDEVVNDARACLRAAHHALGAPRLRPAAICDAVYERLTAGARPR